MLRYPVRILMSGCGAVQGEEHLLPIDDERRVRKNGEIHL